MLVLAAILLLLLAPIAMLALWLFRPKFAYIWLVAAVAALSAWPLILLARLNLPGSLAFFRWHPVEIFPASPELLVDRISWAFALALVSLLIAVTLSDIARSPETSRTPRHWVVLATSSLLTALGLLAVLAGNMLTLLIAWAAIDLVELLASLGLGLPEGERERAVVAFSARIGGLALGIWSILVVRASTGEMLSFTSIPPQAVIYQLLAAWLRLGIFPFHIHLFSRIPLRASLATILRLVPAAASLVIVTRAAGAGGPDHPAPLLLLAAGAAAAYGAWNWAGARDELDGRAYWILGMGAMSLGAALRGQPSASLAWGLAAILPGGLLFLFSTRHRRLYPFVALGLAAMSGLPFTPTWWGSTLYSPFTVASLLFLAAQTGLIAGYLRHAIRPRAVPSGLERWVWLVYPAGLALLFAAHVVLAAGALSGWGETRFPSLGRTWPAFIPSALVVLGYVLKARGFARPFPKSSRVHRVVSLEWAFSGFWGLYYLLRRAALFLNLILEGEGGILWTLLLLSLLIAYLVQTGAGR